MGKRISAKKVWPDSIQAAGNWLLGINEGDLGTLVKPGS
jgi:hypothetical protein